MKRGIALILTLSLLAPAFPGSGLVLAQVTPPPAGGGGDALYPDENVSGGAVAARRPGLRTSAAISRHRELLLLNLRNHGGADPQEIPLEEETELRTLFLVAFLEGVFDVLNNLATALQLAATLGGTGTGAATGT